MELPDDAHATLVPFAPAARRHATVFGAPVELAFVPSRKARHGRGAERPAFANSPADRIVRDEAFWSTDGFALTPNRYPFAAAQRLLWPRAPMRELPLAAWRAAFAWTTRTGGSALLNNIGAAATIAHAHVHLTTERLPFLAGLAERECTLDLGTPTAGTRLVAKRAPFCALGVRGEPEAMAAEVQRLAAARLSAAWNVVAQDGTAWLFPRRLETPAPQFPYALGAAELWGRWCYLDEEPFAAAREPDLEQALLAALAPALPQ
jgi:hypothetical protein